MNKVKDYTSGGYYWEDDNHNRWNTNDYDEETAIKWSNTLIDCKDCVDCKLCRDCTGCLWCEYCELCKDCIRCGYCYECSECSSCACCRFCKKLLCCAESVACAYGVDLSNCSCVDGVISATLTADIRSGKDLITAAGMVKLALDLKGCVGRAWSKDEGEIGCLTMYHGGYHVRLAYSSLTERFNKYAYTLKDSPPKHLEGEKAEWLLKYIPNEAYEFVKKWSEISNKDDQGQEKDAK